MAAPSAEPSVDWATWLARWEAQQNFLLPDREERFDAIIGAVSAFCGPNPRVLDLGCGPGSLSARVLRRLSGAEIVAIDSDPVLLAIGRGALAHERRIHFVDADLRGDWSGALPLPSPFDAAISTTALHWLGLPQLVQLYRSVAAMLRSGGVLLNGDVLEFDHDQAVIAETARSMRSQLEERLKTGEDWNEWWAAVTAEPGLAAEAAERRKRGIDHPHDNESHSYDFHRASLFAAGFSEVGTLWQRLSDRVLVAVR